jgi:superfamily II DNA or RNA helicase
MPLHPKAREFAKSGLFAGLSSFEELEKRIAAITENKGKGDAFEVFAEAYLATQRRHEIGQVWPLDAAPMDLLKKLKLPLKDYGVDGVAQTALGGHQVYQVKFRSGRTPLTWEELSTFMGLSDSPEIQSKVVITNCEELPAIINERHNFFCIRGSDLDRLTGEDFKAIEAWVSEAKITIRKSTPFPHQQEALDAIVPALKSEDRVSAIMACGTGKTLTALWTTEQLGASKVLVLLPSLALLRQTLHEWLKETSLDLAYLCVCSDPTVKGDADEISTAQSDLDFKVSTDTVTVRRFLDAPFKGMKVIFSTYQSAAVVGEAMKKGESFDLGIFDEAHKTAGCEGRNYGYALEDKNIAIRKRLFVTATPRHYNPSKRTKEGEATIAFSMDEPKVYGPQSYVLSFGEAARRMIICGYKVIISVITSDQVTDELLSKGTVAVKGDEIRARQVANQIALRDALAQYGVSKIFTFHSTVKSAESFVADGNEGVRTHLPEFSALHVSGAMPTARRERVMKEFRSAPKAVMSNARCLTEGVDVPAVDMIAFLSPKKSKVDIVQAIGRAMRKSGSKEVGYVLIPIYLEQKAGESIEEAVARANFEEVWDILQSLQEQDEVLAELIRDMAVAKGRGKGFDDSRLSDRIAFTGPVLALESIHQAITTKVLDRLESSWDVNFGKLLKFKEEHGHCEVRKNTDHDTKLSNWVGVQRVEYKRNIITNIKKNRLDSIGFTWDVIDKLWFEKLGELALFKKNHGHCLVPLYYKENRSLGKWVTHQRERFKKKKLPKELVRKLDELGFSWEAGIRKLSWDERFNELVEFKKEFGHCIVPFRWSRNKSLSTWLNNQKQYRKRGSLNDHQIKLLTDIGIVWEEVKDWHERYEELLTFKKKFGHCNVTQKGDYQSLGKWLGQQRSNKKRGHPNIPQSDKDRKLAHWVHAQKRQKRLGLLSEKSVTLLEAIGIKWEGGQLARPWKERFAELVLFKTNSGHCNVPKHQGFDTLYNWVTVQRVRYRKGELSSRSISQLESLGFDFKNDYSPINRGSKYNTLELIKELKLFRDAYGHCNVPKNYSKNPRLGRWLYEMMKKKKSGKISQSTFNLLNELGVNWNSLRSSWDKMYELLIEYIRLNRNASISIKDKNNQKLYYWVIRQRVASNRGTLSKDKKQLLEKIGFKWKRRKSEDVW